MKRIIRHITNANYFVVLYIKIYLKGISYSQHEDFDGALLYAIISVDAEFLYRYLA